MNIIITESQYSKLVESHTEINSKPAVLFDTLYGTNLSQQYDFGDGLTSDDVWDMWVKFRDHDDFEDLSKLINRIQEIFPYIDTTNLTVKQKFEIIMGMASEFNAFDIVSFAVHKVYGDKNLEQKRLEKKLPPEVVHNLQWVLSQHSMDIIRSKFDINEI